MKEEEKEVNRKTWWVMGIIILVLIIGVASYFLWFQQKQMKELSELFALEKAMLLDDYEEVSLQFEGMKYSINNDSLFAQLKTAEEKVDRLKEEVRTLNVTVTSQARQITALKKELETMRSIARSFVVQIDSLNKENENLKEVNKTITQRNQQINQKLAQATRDNQNLTERVNMAAKLNAVNIQLSPVNKNERAARIDRAVHLILTFNIAKNISAPVGEQAVYVRIMRPNDELLKKQNTGVFPFENRNIEYSLMYKIEYAGEEIPVKLYWTVEETLTPGKYRVFIFAAGNQIGQKEFVL